jgi:hypothetical protein
VEPEIMVPLVCTARELELLIPQIKEEVQKVNQRDVSADVSVCWATVRSDSKGTGSVHMLEGVREGEDDIGV